MGTKSRHFQTGTRGFSLLELLAVLAILVVLTSLLMLSSKIMFKAKKQAQDVANLRMIGQAFHGYLADNDQVLPVCQVPAVQKTLAHYLGFLDETDDWSNDSAKNSIFKNGANERAIRKLFVSGSDGRDTPDPMTSYASNAYMGKDPARGQALEDQRPETVIRYLEIKQPARKLYFIPAYFLRDYSVRFSGATTSSPFIEGSNTEYKGPFPALFADGHVEVVESDPARVGRTGLQLRNEMVYPKK